MAEDLYVSELDRSASPTGVDDLTLHREEAK